jgi:hypothetical protein
MIRRKICFGNKQNNTINMIYKYNIHLGGVFFDHKEKYLSNIFKQNIEKKRYWKLNPVKEKLSLKTNIFKILNL